MIECPQQARRFECLLSLDCLWRAIHVCCGSFATWSSRHQSSQLRCAPEAEVSRALPAARGTWTPDRISNPSDKLKPATNSGRPAKIGQRGRSLALGASRSRRSPGSAGGDRLRRDLRARGPGQAARLKAIRHPARSPFPGCCAARRVLRRDALLIRGPFLLCMGLFSRFCVWPRALHPVRDTRATWPAHPRVS